MPLTANIQLILGWSLLLLTLAGFTGYWSWLFYRKLVEGKDPMSAPFLLREIAYTNMFLCFAAIRALPLLGYSSLNVAFLAWGTASTLLVVGSYLLLHRELNRQRRKAGGK